MGKVFFTYVWGGPGNPAWPLTFSTKSGRKHALDVLTDEDLVFTVSTQGQRTPVESRGRVGGVYKVSNIEVNTQDYDLPQSDSDGVARFPFALHPLEVWQITSADNLFAKLVGPLTPTHHLHAQTKVVELDPITAEPLLLLERMQIPLARPRTEFGRVNIAPKNSKLGPKHEGFYKGTFSDHDTWFVYSLVLRDAKRKPLAVKVGYANDPIARETSYNGPMAWEVTGLAWELDLKQPTSTEDAARELEQAILSQYDRHRLGSNGEILRGIDPSSVAASVAMHMRNRPA